jgi:predicted amidohydrolase YtcJ
MTDDEPRTADLCIIGARVFRGAGPGEPLPLGSAAGPRPPGAPTAVAVADGRIAWLGSDADARRDWIGPRTEVIDARGGLLAAGFDDAHIHVLWGARALDAIDLFGIETLDEIRAAIRAGAASRPERPWVVGRGWFYVPFPGGLPTRDELDELVPDRPALLTAYDGHTAWVNSRALALARIHRETPDPPNGLIVRDPTTGEPTGVLKEDAQALVERLIPPPTEAEDERSLERAIAALNAAGITAVQDAWTLPEHLGLWRRLGERGALTVRARLALPMQPDTDLAGWQERLAGFAAEAFPLRGGAWLSAGILKGFVDGVIETRTAAMLAPYEGDTSSGLPNWTPEQLNAFVAAADRAGWQVELHAIGDRAVRMALDAHEHAARTGPWPGDPEGRGAAPGSYRRRGRVEHIETIDPADIGRFGRLGVIASMQPFHGDPSPNQISLWAANIGPERASRAWAAGSILRHGGILAFGSDWPVVPFDPFPALHVAVTRRTVTGDPPGGWLPHEAVDLPAALSAFTLGSAVAAFAESRRGTIAPGLDADLVVLDRDLLLEGPSAIVGTTVRLTVVGGRIVHRLGL